MIVNLGDGRNQAQFQSRASIKDGRWHHIATTFDRDGSMTLFVDGQVDSSVSISNLGVPRHNFAYNPWCNRRGFAMEAFISFC